MRKTKSGNYQQSYWTSEENGRRLRFYAKARGKKMTVIVNEILDDWFKFQDFREWNLKLIPESDQTPYYSMGRFVALFFVLTKTDLPTQYRKLGLMLDRNPRAVAGFLREVKKQKLAETNPELAELMTKFYPGTYSDRKMTEAEALQFEAGFWHERNKYAKGKDSPIKGVE